MVCLRFWASGDMQNVAGDSVNCHQPTVPVTLPRVCDAINKHAQEYVFMPRTPEECYELCAEFRAVASFPFTIGAIDCTHIKIQSPGGLEAERFRNRKGIFSLNVQTTSDRLLRVRNIVARWPGSSHIQTIFDNSAVCQQFERGDFGQFILIGDSGYANTKYLATPFTTVARGLAEDRAMQAYNRSIIATRYVVERQYGVLKRRFLVLAYGMRVKIETVQKIFLTCTILHNIAIDQSEPDPPASASLEAFLADQQRLDEAEFAAAFERGTARDRIMRIFRSQR